MSNIDKIKDIVILWGPTILFFGIIIIATLKGIFRGFRKSSILFIHSVIAFILCFSLFLLLVNNKMMDALLLRFINFFLGDGGMQRLFGVSESCMTTKEIFVEYIPAHLDLGTGLALIIQDNGAYLYSLVDMGYRIVFAITLYILYLILIFIMYIIYLIFYSERKYRKKKHKDFAEKRTEKIYRENHIGGMIVGFTRGFIKAIVVISFIGTLFYVTSGGKGDKELDDVDFGNDGYNLIFDSYRAIDSYGTRGIFKILNEFDDKNNTPYYLFAADIVFQGGLNDPNRNINETIYFREEFATYTAFAKDTYKLIMKYGEDRIKPIILKKSDEEIMDVIIDVMKNPDFQNEFSVLIRQFDSKTYFINLTLSLLDSMIRRIDEIELPINIGDDALEIIKILFKKGHLSKYIPNELKMINDSVTDYDLPCINASSLLNKNDVDVAFRIFVNLLDITNISNIKVDDALTAIKGIVPYLKNLSILSVKQEEFNPLIARLYSYVENRYLENDSEYDETNEYVSYLNDKSIVWIDEFNYLLDAAIAGIDIYDNIKDLNMDIYHKISTVFDKEDANYSINHQNYLYICDALHESKILGKVLSTKRMYKEVENAIISNVSSGFVLPSNIVYENTYDSNNNIIEYGEMYHMVKGISMVFELDLINTLNDNSSNTINLLEEVSSKILQLDDDNNTIIDYMIDSKIIESLISSIIIENKKLNDQIEIYIPNSVLKMENGININIIKEDDLKDLMYKLPDLIELIKPFIENSSYTSNINNLVNNSKLDSLLSNVMIEGTIANAIKDSIKNDNVIIPVSLNETGGWLHNESDSGELRALINFIRGADINIVDSFNSGNIIEKIKEFSDSSITDMYESKIIYYSVSNYLYNNNVFSGFEIIIPNIALDDLEDDVIDNIIIKSKLIYLTKALKNFDFNNMNLTMLNIIKNRNELLENEIILTTLVNGIVNNDSINTTLDNALVIPNTYLLAASNDNLINYTSLNPWNDEIISLLDAIDELLNISNDETFDFDSTDVSTNISSAIANLNDESNIYEGETKLNVVLNSNIMYNTISSKLDDAFNGIVTSSIIDSAKEDGLYKYNEIKALVDFINIYEIDTNNVDEEELTNNIKSSINTLNDIRTDSKYYGLSTLDIIYESIIIRSKMTGLVDDIFDDIIDVNLLDFIRDSNNSYYKSEIYNLVESVKDLGITGIFSISDIENKIFTLDEENIDTIYDSYLIKYAISAKIFEALIDNNLIDTSILNDQLITNQDEAIHFIIKDEMKNLNDALRNLGIDNLESLQTFDYVGSINTLNDISDGSDTKLDIIYDSNIFAGIITKTINDNLGSVLKDNNLAYRNDLLVYRKVEIASLISLLDGKDISEITVSDIKFIDLKDYVLDDYNNTKSYIIVQTMSDMLFDESMIIIPKNTLDSNSTINCILPLELSKLIDAMDALGITEIDSSIILGVTIPDDNEKREIILDSSIIMASITKNFRFVIDGNSVITYVLCENVTIAKDYLDNDIIIMTNDEMIHLFDAINILSNGEISCEFNINTVKANYSSIDLLLLSNCVKIAISDMIIDIYPSLALTNSSNYATYNLESFSIIINKDILDDNTIKTTINLM